MPVSLAYSLSSYPMQQEDTEDSVFWDLEYLCVPSLPWIQRATTEKGALSPAPGHPMGAM